MGKYIKDKEGFEHDPEIILIVHEVTDNPCSERTELVKWFKEHGVELEEYV